MKSLAVHTSLTLISILGAVLAFAASGPDVLPVAPSSRPPARPDPRPHVEALSADTLRAEWTCRGSITAPMLRRVIASHAEELAECDTAASEATTELTLLLRVDDGGRVERGHAVGAVPGETRDCVARAASGWSFPPPIGGECAVVRLPLAMRGS